MLLTLYYMYATLLQCWRISRTRAKLAAVSETAAVLLCLRDRCPPPPHGTDHPILHNGNKLACTATPKKRICLESWLSYSSFGSCLPGGTSESLFSPCRVSSPSFPVLIEADVNTVCSGDQMQLCELGQPLAWHVSERFQAILTTDLDHFSRLVSCFLANDIAIHEGMQVVHMETVQLEGVPATLVHDRLAKKMRWPKPVVTHKQWRHLVEDLKSLCKKVNQACSSHNGALCPPADARPPTETHLAVSEHRHRERRPHRSSRRERSKELTSHKFHDRLKQSSSVDRLETRRDGHADKKESHRSKRERFAKRHSDDRLLDGGEEKPTRSVCASKKFTQEKPPNVLVCADSGDTRQNVTAALRAVLAADTYALYEMGAGEAAHLLDSCTLAVVCGNVSQQLGAQLLQYLLDGGSLLCLCSDFLNTVLHTFTTAEVREHELVHFTYGRWKRVPMMHHIFCYQASPSAERFSQDSEPHSAGNSPVAPRCTPPATVDIRHAGVTRTVHVQVLATEDTWHTPSILLARVRGSAGRAVFSQVHLETDPARYQLDETKAASLRSSDAARLQILADILETHLDVRCEHRQKTGVEACPPLAPAYLLGRNQLKLHMLEQLLGAGVAEGVVPLTNGKLKLQFCGKDARPPEPNQALLPVLVHACPDNFSTVRYFESLQTERLGRLVLYCDTLGSSMDVIGGATYPHGFTVIPRRQTRGVGRAGNVWLSPAGCAMFSLQVHVERESALCGSLPLVQHAVAAAVVAAVRETPGYQHLDIGVKWPNDIYANSRVKLGGVVVSSLSQGAAGGAICNIGVGVNLDNARPTTCLNSLIQAYNETHDAQLQPMHLEQLVAVVLSRLERVLDEARTGDLQQLYRLYYKYWLHADSLVTVRTATQHLTEVHVTGIDQYGFLRVRAQDGSSSSVQPDGNSFDMLRGLIAPKLL